MSYVKTKNYKNLYELINKDIPINIYIGGASGIGKSSSILSIAEDQNRKIYRVNMSNSTDVDDLIGGLRLVNDSTHFEYGPCVKAMIEENCILLLDECLDENEEIRIGTVDNWISVPIKNLLKDVLYQCVSYNIDTRLLENDICYLISNREDEIYEIELEDGRKIRCNSSHPFFNEKHNEVTLKNGLSVNDYIVVL